MSIISKRSSKIDGIVGLVEVMIGFTRSVWRRRGDQDY